MSPMNSFHVFVPGEPEPWPRAEPKVVWMGGEPRAIVYVGVKTPVRRWQHDIRVAIEKVYQGPVMQGLVAITAEFIFARPKKFRRKTQAMPRRFMGDVPDLDNLVKAVKDGLKVDAKKPKRFAVLRDDRQVCHVTATKWYAAHQTFDHGEMLGLSLKVAELDPMPVSFPEPEVPDYVLFEDEGYEPPETKPPVDSPRGEQLQESESGRD